MPDLEPMTGDDRAWLLEEIRQAEQVADGGLSMGLLLFPSGLIGVLAGLVWALAAWALGLHAERPSALGYPVDVLVVALGAALATLASVFRHVRRSQGRVGKALSGMRADLADGRASIEAVTVEGIKIFREPEHGMKLYFLRLEDGRIHVLYDHDSADTEGGGASRRSAFPIHRNLRLTRFPRSGRVRRQWSGPSIRKPRARALAVPPSAWPDDETWTTLAWDDLDRVLGGPEAA
jgi:hypothetical protein